MTLRCAVLDDYQDIALSMADWSLLAGPVDVRTLRRPLGSEDEVVAAIGDCEIVVAMRERTPFPASLLARLPRLRLLVTSGMRNAAIDLTAAARHGVTVCGTASNTEPPVELTWALILGLARHLVTESTAMRADGPWQTTLGADLHGRTLGLLGLGKIGTRVARIGQAFGMNVTAWSRNLTAGRAAEAGVPARRLQGRAPGDRRLRLRAPRARRPHPRPARRGRTPADAAHGVPRQHLPRRHRRAVRAAAGAA